LFEIYFGVSFHRVTAQLWFARELKLLAVYSAPRYKRRMHLKREVALFVYTFICSAAVRSGEVKVEVMMTAGPDDLVNEFSRSQTVAALTSFAADTPMLYAIFKTRGVRDGDKIRVVCIADDIGDAAPRGIKIDEGTLTATGDTEDSMFTLSKPANGWPVGQYHTEVYVNDQLAAKASFTIRAAKK
jgi:hypothetical protein